MARRKLILFVEGKKYEYLYTGRLARVLCYNKGEVIFFIFDSAMYMYVYYIVYACVCIVIVIIWM